MTSLSTCVAAVLLTSGKRVLCWDEASVVAHTGTPSRGIARSDVQVLQPGAYTLVLLTSCSHDENATPSKTSAAASFSVIVESNVRVSVDILPMLGAGMYRRSAHAKTLPHAWQVHVPRAMPLLICAATDAPDHANEPATMTIRLEKNSSSLCESRKKLPHRRRAAVHPSRYMRFLKADHCWDRGRSFCIQRCRRRTYSQSIHTSGSSSL